MRRTLAALLTGVVIGSTGVAGAAVAGGWRVLATGNDNSDYYSAASTHIDKTNPQALRVRAYGKDLKLSGSLNCQFDERSVQSGQVFVPSVKAAKSCSVWASATAAKGGLVRVQIEGKS